MAKCDRCGHPHACQFAVCLVNVDADSIEEGCHVGEVNLNLCNLCEEPVADALLQLKEVVLRRPAVTEETNEICGGVEQSGSSRGS